jgi:hypothetical protein
MQNSFLLIMVSLSLQIAIDCLFHYDSTIRLALGTFSHQSHKIPIPYKVEGSGSTEREVVMLMCVMGRISMALQVHIEG